MVVDGGAIEFGSAAPRVAGSPFADRFLRARWQGPLLTSFAQNGEDVRLWRVLGDRPDGFYVDVGAGHPTAGSVTRLFYDKGWTGINIEPGPDIQELREARPRDTNLELAIAADGGTATMSISAPDPGLSSLRPAPSDALPDGFSWITTVVRTARLEDVTAEHADGREIDFLKVDVEGLERDVLESFDPLAIRPKVVLVEAVSPLTHQPTHDEWEPLLLEADYVFAAFDGVNRFYVPVEHDELVPALSYPISALDHYVTWSPLETDTRATGPAPPETRDEQVARLEAAVLEAAAVHEAMKSTLSWRITKPLRAIRRAPRRRLAQRRGSRERLFDAARLEAAFETRLRDCLTVVTDQPPSSSSGLRTTLTAFGAAAGSLSVPSAAWLGLLCATGSYPEEERQADAARVLRSEGAQAFVEHLDLAFRAALEANAASDRLLDVVSGEIVVDVSQVASSDLHTGVQRVAREAVARWIHAQPSLRLAFFDESANVLRLLADEEKERIVHWRNELGGSGSGVGQRTPVVSERAVVPWNCRVVVPELPDRRRTFALRGLVEARVHRSLSLIGFDLIPMVAAETVARGFPETFSHYLSLVKTADRVSTISRQSAHDFGAFASMLPGVGITRGPLIEAHSLPTVAPPLGDPEVEAARRTLGFSELPLVLTVGSHEPRKNHVLTLEAAEHLWASGHTFQMAFLGGSGWNEHHGFTSLVTLLRARGRPIVVRRRATEHELWAAYRLARFTLFPSLVEGYGLPVAESLASGTPAITSDYGSMAEIASGGGALLVDPRDVEAIAAQMRLLLTDVDLLERLRAEARALDFGSWDGYANDVWEFLVGEEPEETT